MRFERIETWPSGRALAALRTVDVGRLSLTFDAMPKIMTVPFAVDGHDLAVSLYEAGRVPSRINNAVVAFEAGEFDPVDQQGWSVHVLGLASIVDGPAAQGLALARITPDIVDGHTYRAIA